MSYASMLDSTCSIDRPTTTTTSGSVSVSYSTVATGVRCSFQLGAGTSRDGPPIEMSFRAATCWLPTNQDVRDGDVIHSIAGRGASAAGSERYRVLAAPHDAAGRGVVRPVTVRADEGASL